MAYKAPWQLEEMARKAIAQMRATGDAEDIARALEAVFEYAKLIDDLRGPPDGLR